MRERVAIVFMTLSVLATLGLGGAVAYELAHRGGAATLRARHGLGRRAGVHGSGQHDARRRGAVAASGGIPTGGSAGSAARNERGSGSQRQARARARPRPAGRRRAPRPARSAARAGRRARRRAASTKQSTAAPVAHHGVITVGGIYDETGPIDATVERDTVRSYFDLVNSQGGVNGYKLQLIDCDSKYDPSSAHRVRAEADQRGRARDRRLAVALRRADRDSRI